MTRLYSGHTTVEANADLEALLSAIPAGRNPRKLRTYLENNAVFNVMDYPGADNTGATSIVPAVNAAVANAVSNGRGLLYWPEGLYSYDQQISVVGWNNITARSASRFLSVHQPRGTFNNIFTTFPLPNTPPAWNYASLAFVASNLRFERMGFDMRYESIADQGVTTPTLGSGQYAYRADNYQYPLNLLFVDGVVIDDCEFRRGWYNGVEIYGCSDVWIQNSRFRNIGDKANFLGHYSGVEVDAYSKRVHVVRNIMTDVGYGFSLNASNTNQAVDGVPGAEDISFEDNLVVGTQRYGAQADGRITGLSISRNRFRRIANGAVSVTFNEVGTNNYLGAHGVAIDDNIIIDYNTAAATGVAAIDATAADLSVERNKFKNSLANDGGKSYYGIYTHQLTETIASSPVATGGVVIQGNVGRGTFVNGHIARSDAIDTTMQGNRGIDAYGDCVSAFQATAAGSVERDNDVSWTTTRGPRATRFSTGRAPFNAVGPDRGDADVALTLGADAPTQQFLSAINNNRTVSIAMLGASNGDRWRIVRRGLGTGTLTISYPTNHTIKVMPAATAAWCEVDYDATNDAWVLTGYGLL